MVSDQTIVRLNPPLIRPFPSWSDLWSHHLQTEVASDHTIAPNPVILVWEHAVCVGLGVIRGQLRMAPQPGIYSS